MATSLTAKLQGIPWADSIATFHAGKNSADVEDGLQLLSVWASQFEQVDSGNPALAFVREMQVQGHHAAVCIALGLYKPAAGCLRALLECGLYYTFFRLHPAELATTMRDNSYYMGKHNIIEYHKAHTARWSEKEQAIGLNGRLTEWYGEMSRVIHGQSPGSWLPPRYKGVGDIRADAGIEKTAAKALLTAVELVHHLFLVSVAPDVWAGVEIAAKRTLLKGLIPAVRAKIGLSAV